MRIIHKFVTATTFMEKATANTPVSRIEKLTISGTGAFNNLTTHLSLKNMKNNWIQFFLSLFFLAGGDGFYAQNCFAPSAVCSNSAFVFGPATGAPGLPANLFTSNPTFGAPSGPNAGCQYNDAVNPQWLLINVTASGVLGFNLGAPGSANPQNGLLHWSLYPYSANACNDIFNDILPPIACNYNCSSIGGTGLGALPPPPANPCNYYVTNINVLAGEQYLLLVSNVNGTNTAISFNSTGTAQLGCSPFTVSSATACPNQSTVVAASWPGYTNLTYTLTPPAPALSYTQASSNFTVSSPSTQVFTVDAMASNPYGQLTRARQLFTLTINPTATIAVAHATDYCYGSNITITVIPAGSTVTAYGPTVSPVLPLTTFTDGIVVIPNATSPNSNGVYGFTATLPTGCIGSTTAQINVAPNYAIAMQNGQQNVCQGNNILLTANLTTATSYTWNGPCLTNSVTNGNVSVNNVQAPVCSGIYTVNSTINYNTIQCPRQGTVLVDVVPTYSIDVQPTYTVCQGSALTLTAAANNAGSYSWIGPSTFTSITQNPLVTNSVTPVHGGNYVVTAYFSNGNLSCPRTNTINVSVVGIYPVSVLVPTTICQYATANMFISAAGAPTSYSWTGPNSFTATTPAAVISNIQPAAIGTYTGMATWVQGTVECVAYGYNNITVVPVNSITTSDPAPICQPASVGLLANALGAISYSWTGPNGFSASIPNPVIYYAPLNATGVYTVSTLFNSGGLTCGNTATVFVSVNPVLNYSLPGFIRTCVGESLTVTGPVGATSYSWSSSSGLAIDAPNAKDLIFSSLKEENTGIYTLDAALGPCVTSKQVEIKVFSAVEFSLAPTDYEECKGVEKLVIVGAKGGSENYAFEWTPESFLSSPTGSVVVAKPMGTTVYNVTVRDLACPNRTVSHSFVFKINRAPMPNLNLGNLEGCEPYCIKLDPGLPSDAGTILTYDFGGVRKVQIKDSLYTYCGLNEPGSYTLKIYSKGLNNCKDSATIPVPIVVHPKSRSDIQWSPEIPSTTDNIVTFSSYSKSNANVVTYDWSFAGTGVINGMDTTNMRNPQRKYEEVGKYPVMLISTTDKGCQDTTVKFLDIKDEMNVFIPNTFSPNNDGINDMFQVKGLGFRPEGFTMEIFDRWGHLVYSTRDVTKGWDGSVKGQTPSEGVYIYRVKAIGTNGEGRKEFTGHVTLIK